MKIWIGIDNGVSGSIGIIGQDGNILSQIYVKTPIKKEQNYTKKEQTITRIDGNKLFELFEPHLKDEVRVIMERPMVNPQFFYATQSALRALEATLIVLEKCGFKYEIIDSTKWQDVLLPEIYEGVKVEKENLKSVSLAIGNKLFPQIDYKGFKDADGILIAQYCKQKYP
jgi:hypothetical protein